MKTVYQLSSEEFEQRLILVKGQGKKSLKGQLSLEEFVIIKAWSFDVDYEYKNNSTKVSLICDQGHHCSISPNNFKKGAGCAKCAGLCPIQARENLEELVLSRVWDFAADYEYKGDITKVSLICDQGHTVLISPTNFKSGKGCPKCSGKCTTQAKEQLETEILSRAWDFAADYEYKNAKTKVSLICDRGHHCSISPNDFKTGYGCAKCAKNGFQPNLPASLYLTSLSIDSVIKGYKLGITNNSVETRMASHNTHSIFDHVIVETYKFSVGQDALDLENILKLELDCNYFTKEQLPDGHTETISPDQLNEFYKVVGQ